LQARDEDVGGTEKVPDFFFHDVLHAAILWLATG
jgi:hypothetical protein